jgi:hypothetical protein
MKLDIQPLLSWMDVWMDVGESWFNVGVEFGRMIFLVGA